MSHERVAQFLREHDVRTVEIGFPDTHGILRGKRVATPYFLDKVRSGFAFAKAVLVWDLQCGVFPEYPGQEWTNFDNGYGDLMAVPDLSTLRLVPWRERTAMVLCDLFEDGAPCQMSSRSILRRVVQEAEDLGYAVDTAAELEFYVLDEYRRPYRDGLQTYSLNRGADLEPVLEEIRISLEDMGILIEACNMEHGPAQVEINLRHAPALQSADNALLFKYVVKEVCKKHGLMASFMPKPFADASGNGLHLHQSLWDPDRRQNLFSGDEEFARQYIGGLLASMREFYVLGAPSVNAYKRRRTYTFAPTNVTWGGNNRTVAVRALLSGGYGSRVEQRCGSADANPYLFAAANLAAGVQGIKQGLQPGDPTPGDAYAVKAQELPFSLGEALDLFVASPAAHTIFGTPFVNLFASIGRHEVDLWNAAITDWERDRYLEWA